MLAFVPSAGAQMTAGQILARVSDAYRGLKTYQIEATDTYTSQSAEAQTTLLLAVDEGGKLRLERDDGQHKIIVVSNGDTTWTYSPQVHQYSVLQSAASIVQGEGEDNPDDPVSRTENLLVTRYRALERFADKAKLDGDQNVNVKGQKIPCYVAEVQIDRVHIKLWVDQERFLVLRQDQTDPSGVLSKLEIKQFSSASPLDSDLFEFTPPANARKVEALPGHGSSLVGKPARDFKLKDTDGREGTVTAQYVGGRSEDELRAALRTAGAPAD